MIKCIRCNRERKLVRKTWCSSCHTVLRRQGAIDLLPKKALPLNFTETQKEYILGSLLGDGCIFRHKSTHQPHMIINRSQKDRKHLIWESNILEDFTCRISDHEIYDKRTNKTYYQCRLTTHRSLNFATYYNKWYNKKYKKVPQDLVLSPLTLAVWFSDDGNVRPTCSPWRLRLKLSTNGFDKDDVEFLHNLLCQRYQEKFNIIIDDNKYIIDASDLATRAFCHEIDTVFPQSMIRKAYWRQPNVRFYENEPGKKRISRERIFKNVTGISKNITPSLEA